MSENHTSLDNKSYEIITEELVKEALHKDKGENAELLSWEIKDFTNKGDGYMSVITSIPVKYKENEKEFNTCYVAKLNPLRPKSSLSDLNDGLFERESTIISNIIEGMNKQLELLDLPPIKTPKVFARTLEKGKEGFIAENLRTQGFVMHDKMKGQDVNHALMVVEELGRFHASSLLFEETFAPKTFDEKFENFEEPWLVINSPHIAAFGAMFETNAKGAIFFLSSIPKYEKCVKWLETNSKQLINYYVEAFMPSKPFDVLVHGDSWTNNMLFKYDEKNKLVDMRFVDLQCTRKASPATDLMYFFYSSLTGDVRTKNFKELLHAYYQSFSRVLSLAEKSVPFTFKEFEEEVEKRKIFGLTMAVFFQGVLFAEEDEIFDFNNFSDDTVDAFTQSHADNFLKIAERASFKDRFLAVLDEMLEIGIFDN